MIDKIKNILEAFDDLKLHDINVYDLLGNNPFFDYMIIATANNINQMRSVVEKFKERNIEFDHVEGQYDSGWILIDALDIIINVMNKESRDNYNLDNIYQIYSYNEDEEAN